MKTVNTMAYLAIRLRKRGFSALGWQYLCRHHRSKSTKVVEGKGTCAVIVPLLDTYASPLVSFEQT